MTKPIDITADKQRGTLVIEWEDHHTSTYSFSLLRAACPCAECRGGHANMSSKPNPAVFEKPQDDGPASRLDRIEVVGTFAICPRWQDGHDFGIFTWPYLRALCPCAECRADSIPLGTHK